MKKLLLVFVVSIFLFNCNGQKKSSDNSEAADTHSGEAVTDSFDESSNSGRRASERPAFDRPNNAEWLPLSARIDSLSKEQPKLPFSTAAHARYLNDPLVFENIPDGGIPEGHTAVVGSDVCYFYLTDSISSEDELENLPQGELIPFATIISLGEKLENSNDQWGNMFKFQENYNYFYKTSRNGKQGIVFGADLYGIESSNMTNRISALLYKDSGHFDSFYPVTGYDDISAGIRKELETNGLVFQEVKQSEYSLSAKEKPDDMISLYQNITGWEMIIPVFVTTDLGAHANHLVFDRLLQHLEEDFFFPQLGILTDEYIRTIENQKGQIPEEIYNTSLLYFQTAQALLALAPEKKTVGNDYDKTIEYQDIDAAEVLRDYPPEVVEEIEKMNREAGFGSSSIFNFPNAPAVILREDYSQYKARGHYTKNGILGAYFRALMWFGRINFNLGDQGGDTRNLAEHLAPIALFIADITNNSNELMGLWKSLFDPITEIIGASDDIGFNELIPLWNKIKGTGFAWWYNDKKNLDAFISGGYTELRPPSISGSSLFQGPHAGGPEPENRLPPIGWRLFGQRYTLDSEIHHHVSAPRILNRDMVRGLDILKVFGSKTADRLLRQSDYSMTPELEPVLNSLQRNIENVKEDYWSSGYYTNVLNQIRTLGTFENGAGFYFTEKPGWNLKAMNTAHGTWAELRHDTILYVKQNYGEKGGGYDGPTFRTKPLPDPIHYIEPNVPFWITSARGIQKIYTILAEYDYLDRNTARVLQSMAELFIKASEISKLEAEDKEVSQSDLAWIRRVPNELAKLVLLNGGEEVDDIDSLRMALVADVFTNAETGVVLEVAVGIPHRLYIPLNDRQGGKRIALGYGFSYYEFTQPMSQRLTNEEWKAVVYGNAPNMSRYLPFWMEGKVQPSKWSR